MPRVRISQLLKVTHPDGKVETIGPSMTASELAKLISTMKMGAFPVMDGKVMVGIISERDLVTRVMAEEKDPATTLVRDVMTPFPAYVSPFTDMMDAMNLMQEMKIRHVPVLENAKLVGLVSIRDFLVLILKDYELNNPDFGRN